jgi:hypothetical protein
MKFVRKCAVWIAQESIGFGIGILVGMRSKSVLEAMGDVKSLTKTTIELARDGYVRYVSPHDVH